MTALLTALMACTNQVGREANPLVCTYNSLSGCMFCDCKLLSSKTMPVPQYTELKMYPLLCCHECYDMYLSNSMPLVLLAIVSDCCEYIHSRAKAVQNIRYEIQVICTTRAFVQRLVLMKLSSRLSYLRSTTSLLNKSIHRTINKKNPTSLLREKTTGPRQEIVFVQWSEHGIGGQELWI